MLQNYENKKYVHEILKDLRINQTIANSMYYEFRPNIEELIADNIFDLMTSSVLQPFVLSAALIRIDEIMEDGEASAALTTSIRAEKGYRSLGLIEPKDEKCVA